MTKSQGQVGTRLFQRKAFRLTNTQTGKREEFKPQRPPAVLFYSCGPTVYGPLHIGNARALIFSDLLYRWLLHIGYEVNYVRNYTDVDDKIINRANEEKIAPQDVARKYIEYCETDMSSLGIRKPTRTVTVTETMAEIIRLIHKIVEKGHAYVVDGPGPDGELNREVLYSIESFKGYGKLSGKNVEDLKAGARVEVDARKRNPLDFALWKPFKPGEPFWESPWGKGRPGWHIECSAMVGKWLGETIDLHHGGQDLIFPHHENEIAQSEAATGKEFCRHWVHHAFMTMGNEKMSKSLGNIFTIRDFVGAYGAELLKFIYLSHHFRSTVDFTEDMLAQVLGDLERVYLAKKWALAASQGVGTDSTGEWKKLQGRAALTFESLEDELFSDLNTPGALGHLFSHIREINRVESLAAGKPGMEAPPSAERAAVAREFLGLLEKSLHPLWNVFGEDPQGMLYQIEVVRRSRKPTGVLPTDDEIKTRIAERAQARNDRDFKRADEIRQRLEAQGILLVDGPTGTTWKVK